MDNILKGIYTALNRNPGNDISLIGGRAGIALFNFAYLKYQAPGAVDPTTGKSERGGGIVSATSEGQ